MIVPTTLVRTLNSAGVPNVSPSGVVSRATTAELLTLPSPSALTVTVTTWPGGISTGSTGSKARFALLVLSSTPTRRPCDRTR